MRYLRWFVVPVVMLALAGCKVELYSELNEEEANEMVSLLLANGIDASKGSVNKGLVALNVEDADLSTAVEILRQNGYPRDRFHDLGAIFQQQGLISSPLEEQVRFVYGLSQTVSETLTQIDGVITARVHVVVPEANAIGETESRPTASVFLKTRPGVNLDSKITQIKLLVQAAVEGLAYDDVVIAIFEADPVASLAVEGPPMAEFMGIRYTADSRDRIMILGSGTAIALLLIGGFLVFLFIRRNRRGAVGLPMRKNA